MSQANNSPFDESTLETLQYLKHENPHTSPILKNHRISIAIVLGTGLGPFVDGLKGKVQVPYSKIPNMPQCTIQGHEGNIVIGYFEGESKSTSTDAEREKHYCVVYAGRVHAYEGISYHDVCYQVKLSAALGCQRYILTNSTGGLQDGMYEGCLFLIKDHLRFIGRTDPLFEMRYAAQWKVKDTKHYWDDDFQRVAKQCAGKLGVELFEGTYVYASGPTYETPLEVQTAIKMGGGVVGMSTVAEGIAANAYGMKVLGVSMVTNLGAGISTKMLTHDEVQENAANAIPRFILLLQEIVREVHVSASKPLEFSPHMYQKPLVKRSLHTKNLAANIEEAIKFLENELNISKDTLSPVFYIASDKTLIESLNDAKCVGLKDVPHFPSISIAGNVGAIHYGQLGDKQSVLMVRTGNREGFFESESAFLALLAYRLGMRQLVHTLQGEHIDGESHASFTIVDDFLNMSASTRPLSTMKSICKHSMIDAQKEPLMKTDTPSDKRVVYLSFQSPSRSSSSEETMGRLVGAHIIGRTNLSPLYSFRYLGMDVHAVRTSSHNKQPKEYIEFMHAFAHNDSREIAPQRDILPLREQSLPISASNIQNEPLINYDHIQEATKFVRSHFGTDPEASYKHAILDLDLKLNWDKDLVVQSLPLSDIPNISNYYADDFLKASTLDLLPMGTGENATHVFSISGCFDGSEPFYTADGSFFVRLFQQLGVREIILTASLRRVQAESRSDVVYSLKDHINYTGENPLIGHNVPEWGPRFPDATTVYSIPFPKPEGVEIKEVNCLFTGTNRLLRLQAEEDMANNLHCQVLGNQAIREMITSTHCKSHSRIRVGLLGLLEDHEAGTVEKLKKVITTFFNQIE